MKCVVCGEGFNAVFDEKLNIFPIYHPQKDNSDSPNCETQFFTTLLSIYKCLHSQDTSIQLPLLMKKVDWGIILMRKEMILWSLQRGYLTLDDFQRILVPPALDGICNDLFTTNKLTGNGSVLQAIEYLKSAYRVLRKELTPASFDKGTDHDEPAEIDQPLDNKNLRRMFTAEMSGIDGKTKTKAGEQRRGMYSR